MTSQLTYGYPCINSLLHLFFPHNCLGCGSDEIETAQILCIACRSALPATKFSGIEGNPIERIFLGRLSLEHATAGFYFTKKSMIQKLLHQLKYKQNKEVGVYLGEILGRELLNAKRLSNIDLIHPLPLHPKKEKLRGYNQATYIAKGIGNVFKKPICLTGVVRKDFTSTQTKKSRLDRWANIENAFVLQDRDQLIDKHILLVDDVITTGATLEACGRIFLQLPQVKLSVATLAYTV
ncbi:MAG: hypothetical protein QM528_04360 [Phycisphaerales bacterium]|nr:hypothetical protein [Phycisphaerales bacterium]